MPCVVSNKRIFLMLYIENSNNHNSKLEVYFSIFAGFQNDDSEECVHKMIFVL